MIDWMFVLEVALRSILAVAIGALLGNERARHGKAAGMRTHILVCLGAALTAMTGIYVDKAFGGGGDIMRISAQVVSGIGFVGAGMIVIKHNSIITGLTTAAGVWATSIIGLAVGYGFYFGAVIATGLFIGALILFGRLGKGKEVAEIIYVEIDDMYRTNEVIAEISGIINIEFSYEIIAAKSNNTQHIGINIIVEHRNGIDEKKLLGIENVVFVEE